MALGQLLKQRTLNNRSNEVRNLNFKNAAVRGGDLRRTVVSLGKYSKNNFNFNKVLARLVGAKTDADIGKKIEALEFNNSMLFACAIGAQMQRLEMRYVLNGITFLEAYVRKLDQSRTLISIMIQNLPPSQKASDPLPMHHRTIEV